MDEGIEEENPERGQGLQSRSTIIFAVVFLGLLGVHRKMMGYKNWWLMLLSFGGFGIWTLVDFIRILNGRMKMADGSELGR